MQVGVLLIAAGTILGGVWADYSWGRFWGWDPKEVWALITLLVYLIPLHGRFAGWVNTFWLVVASVVCFLSVIMAWYGVNFVLGVGLHSYGFVEGGSQGVMSRRSSPASWRLPARGAGLAAVPGLSAGLLIEPAAVTRPDHVRDACTASSIDPEGEDASDACIRAVRDRAAGSSAIATGRARSSVEIEPELMTATLARAPTANSSAARRAWVRTPCVADARGP